MNKNSTQAESNMSSVNQTVEIFMIEDTFQKILLVSAQTVLCLIAGFILISMIKFNNNRPIQKQNLSDNLLLNIVCPLLLIEVFAFWIFWSLRICFGPLPLMMTLFLSILMRFIMSFILLILLQWNILKILFKSMILRIGQINEDFFQLYLFILNFTLVTNFGLLGLYANGGMKYGFAAEVLSNYHSEVEEKGGEFLINMSKIDLPLNLTMYLLQTHIPVEILSKLRRLYWKSEVEDTEAGKSKRSANLPPVIKDPYIVECSIFTIITYISFPVFGIIIFYLVQFYIKNLDDPTFVSVLPNSLLFLMFMNLHILLAGIAVPIICLIQTNNTKMIDLKYLKECVLCKRTYCY